MKNIIALASIIIGLFVTATAAVKLVSNYRHNKDQENFYIMMHNIQMENQLNSLYDGLRNAVLDDNVSDEEFMKLNREYTEFAQLYYHTI